MPDQPSSLPPDDGRDIDGLIAAHLDDALEPPQAERLFAALKADPRARRTLLSSAVQASALARDALDGGTGSASDRAPRSRGTSRHAADPKSRRAMWVAIAAGLVAAAGAWWTSAGHADPAERLLRVDASVAMTAVRGGSPLDLASDPWLRAGDHLVVGDGEARISWPGEGTAVTIGGGSEIDVVSVRGAKQLRLPHGRITAEVAAQGSGRGFSIATAKGEVSVVGTKFGVAADGRATSVHVDHGVVRVAPADGGPTMPVEAGFDAVCDGEGPIRVIPANAAPGSSPSSAPGTKTVRLDAATFAAYTDRLGSVDGGDIVATKGSARTGDDSVVKIQFRAPGGDLMRFASDFELRASVDLDVATTVSVLLVYEHPEASGSWMGNVQAERLLAPGRHDLVFTHDDFEFKTGTRSDPQAPARVAMVVVMGYSPSVKLVLHDLELRGSVRR